MTCAAARRSSWRDLPPRARPFISNGYLIDRGHAAIAERLRSLGADVSVEAHDAELVTA